ncbi:hypothetical protein [Flavobacterium sp.]|uniref:hypothetical protein n=1 Tax=Flavobacterium sp. TaxID=239 RepID=UPI0031E10BB5
MGNKKENPIAQALLGVFITGLGIYSYKLFGKSGDNNALSVASELLFKYALSGFLFTVGIKTFFVGIKRVIIQDEDDDEVEEVEEVEYEEQVTDNDIKFESEDITFDIQNEEFGVKRTYNFKVDLVGNKIRTERIIKTSFSDYVSNVENKKLYFETVIYLMKFIQEHDKSVDINTNKFYILAKENVEIIEDFDILELEKRIIENAEKCDIEFNEVEIHSILSNSVNILQGKLVINSNITNLYFKIFEIIKIRKKNYEVYFYGLLG